MTARTWNAEVVTAAQLLVREHGVDGAIAELNDRRRCGDNVNRATEALAWIKRFKQGDTL